MENGNQGLPWQALVVEDEPDNLEVIVATLRWQKMTVRTARNGFEAIEALKDFTPNFVLCDLAMPDMNGWQTLTAIRNNSKTALIPVIALSAYAMVGDREKALASGFDGYITKPIDVLTFFDTLKVILGSIVRQIPATKDKKPTTAPEKTAEPTPLTTPPPGQNNTNK
ncbi:MAG TPA: response regulator [Aggregatilineales bacterium]|nr:response regulator [Aggregatilineales bacterium]